MYAAGTHRIIDTGECLIENAQAKQIIRAVRSLMLRFGIPPYDEDRGTGFMRHAVVRVGHTTGEVLVTLVTNGQQFPGAKSFCRELVGRCRSSPRWCRTSTSVRPTWCSASVSRCSTAPASS